ncbi:MAG: ribulose-phosphate 3-epimerase [Chloroflexota bacterium]
MQPSYKLAPSILAADFTQLGEQVREAEAAGADLLHLDVMDGHFVPNISFGPMVVAAVRRVTNLPLDVHLMIENPEKYLDVTAKAGATMINVHIETCPRLDETIRQIKALRVRPGIAINPETPFEKIRDFIGKVDRVLVMTVHPGFGGQKFLTDMLPKIAQIAAVAKELDHPLEIGIDGGVDVSTIEQAMRQGGNVLIAGSSVFHAEGGIAAGVAALRDVARRVR